jgi:hypothetical protein
MPRDFTIVGIQVGRGVAHRRPFPFRPLRIGETDAFRYVDASDYETPSSSSINRSNSDPSLPIIVYVFPLPVYPYANTVPLKPSSDYMIVDRTDPL